MGTRRQRSRQSGEVSDGHHLPAQRRATHRGVLAARLRGAASCGGRGATSSRPGPLKPSRNGSSQAHVGIVERRVSRWVARKPSARDPWAERNGSRRRAPCPPRCASALPVRSKGVRRSYIDRCNGRTSSPLSRHRTGACWPPVGRVSVSFEYVTELPSQSTKRRGRRSSPAPRHSRWRSAPPARPSAGH